MSYITTGVIRSVGHFVEVGTDAAGVIQLRRARPGEETIWYLKPETAIRLSELLSQAACGPADKAAPSETLSAARKMIATHKLVARSIVQLAGKSDTKPNDVVNAIASALANELRKGAALCRNVDADNALVSALAHGNDPEPDRGSHGLGDN